MLNFLKKKKIEQPKATVPLLTPERHQVNRQVPKEFQIAVPEIEKVVIRDGRLFELE